MGGLRGAVWGFGDGGGRMGWSTGKMVKMGVAGGFMLVEIGGKKEGRRRRRDWFLRGAVI